VAYRLEVLFKVARLFLLSAHIHPSQTLCTFAVFTYSAICRRSVLLQSSKIQSFADILALYFFSHTQPSAEILYFRCLYIFETGQTLCTFNILQRFCSFVIFTYPALRTHLYLCCLYTHSVFCRHFVLLLCYL
jgi:hypothetical protein